MARKPRIHFSGAVYHVILTGLDQQAVFKTVSDRRYWDSLIADGVKRFGYSVHAFDCSKGQVNMAIQVKDAPLSKIMQNLTFRYTRHFNGSHGRQGPLFHGRYKAIVIDADQYLNELVRYIHNGPIRRKQSKTAESSKWTSHAAYLDVAKQPEWLTTTTVLQTFGKTDKTARKAFAKFVDDGKDEGDRLELTRGSSGGRILGDKKFVKRALKPVKPTVRPFTLNQLVKRVCREEGVKEAQLLTASRARLESQIRQTITYLAMELQVASLTDMAKRFNRDLTTMSRNQRYYRDKLADDKALQRHVSKIKRQLLANA